MNARSSTIKRGCLILVVAIFSLLSASSAKAILIDFETSSGYSLGSLIGQTPTGSNHAWRGTSGVNANILQVTADANGQYLKASNISGASGGPSFIFDSTSSDVGGTAEKPFDATSSVLSFSFDFRYDDTLASSANSAVRFRIGNTTTPAIALEFLTTGQIYYNDGSSYNYKVKTASNTNFTATKDAWISISGTINYLTGTYTLYINGVEQTGNSSTQSLAFATTDSQNATILIRDLASGTANFVGYSIDNINLAMIPEPAAYGIILAALSALLFIMRFKKNNARS